ncbi:MAG: MFS transporter [Acidimicrobiia bacterium]|nr:MFS transporter [Acidimicrobiia bacterium]
MNPNTTTGVRNRFLILVALRWLPVGLVAPILVLIPRSKGLSLSEIGVMFAIYGLTTAALELPTGGLADALGRRTILIVSAVLTLVFTVLLLVADTMVGFGVATFFGGMSRALDSGPLEAWFVDRTRELDPDAGIRGGLSAGGTIDGIALALGAIAGGLIPAMSGSLGPAIVTSLIAGVVYLIAIPLLMTADGPRDQTFTATFAEVPAVVGSGIRLGFRHRPIRLLLLASAALGIGLSSVELLWQPHFIALGGGADTDTGPLGFILASGFALAGLGSALAPRLTKWVGGDPRHAAFTARLLIGVMLAGLASATGFGVAVAAFVGFYFMNGLGFPVENELLHDQVSANVRTTVLSIKSLSLQAGGLVASLTIARLAEAAGISTAWWVAASVLALSSIAFLRLPTHALVREH